MRGLLVYPPSADPTIPPISQARIASVISDYKIDFEFTDDNLRFVNWVLLRAGNKRLKKFFEDQIENYKKLYKKNLSSSEATEQIKKIHSAYMFSQRLKENIVEAKSILKSPEKFFNITEYIRAYRNILKTLHCFSALYGKTEIGYTSAKLIYRPEDPENIKLAIRDKENNPYFDFLSCRAKLYLEYSAVFISVIYTSQLIPSLTLAYLLKDENPKIKIILGGPCASVLSWGLREYFGGIVDAIGKGDGDYLFKKWDEKLSDEESHGVEKSGNSDKADFNLNEFIDFINTTSGFFDLNTRPEYSIFRVTEYPLPFDVFPLDITRGCYWKKCVFCAYGFPGAPYRRMPVSEVISLMVEQEVKRGIKYYFFSVDTVDPAYMRELAENIVKNGIDVRYYVDLRMEKNFADPVFADLLYKSGCRVVSFGMESCYKSTLERMGKGTEPEYFSDILRCLSEAGIHINIHLIHGFPGDTEDGIRRTLEFLEKHRKYIMTAGVSQFALLSGSLIERDYRKYGIREIRKPGPFSLYYDFEYKNSNGRLEGFFSETNSEINKDRSNYLSYEDFKRILHDFFPPAGRLTGSTSDYLLYASRYSPAEMKNILEQARVLVYRED